MLPGSCCAKMPAIGDGSQRETRMGRQLAQVAVGQSEQALINGPKHGHGDHEIAHRSEIAPKRCARRINAYALTRPPAPSSASPALNGPSETAAENQV